MDLVVPCFKVGDSHTDNINNNQLHLIVVEDLHLEVMRQVEGEDVEFDATRRDGGVVQSKVGNLHYPVLSQHIQPAWMKVKSSLTEWKKITRDQVLLQVIQCGVRFPMNQKPVPCYVKENKEVLPYLLKLEQQQIVRRLTADEFKRTSVFVIPKKGGTGRLITDVRI